MKVLNGDRNLVSPSFFKTDKCDKLSLDELKDDNAIRLLTSLAIKKNSSFRGWAILSQDELLIYELEAVPSSTGDNPHHHHIPFAKSGYGADQTRNQILTSCIVGWQESMH